MNRNQAQDITELLFPSENLTLEEKRKMELWNVASQEAYKLVGASSPIKLLEKTEELYKEYLSKGN